MSAFLLVLFSILVVLLLLLFCAVHAIIFYDDQGFSVLIRYLFLRIRFPKAQKPSKAKNPSPSDDEGKRRGSYRNLISLLQLVVRCVGKLLKAVRVRNLEVDAVIASEDPFKTAMLFGTSGVGVGLLLPLLEKHFRLKRKTINVNANFEETEPTIFLRADCSVLLIQLLAIALVFAYNFLKEQKMRSSSQRKDGKNVRAKSE